MRLLATHNFAGSLAGWLAGWLPPTQAARVLSQSPRRSHLAKAFAAVRMSNNSNNGSTVPLFICILATSCWTFLIRLNLLKLVKGKPSTDPACHQPPATSHHQHPLTCCCLQQNCCWVVVVTDELWHLLQIFQRRVAGVPLSDFASVGRTIETYGVKKTHTHMYM